MAIPFGRLEFVKRSEGKTSCQKAAYNSRSRIEFEGNPFISARTYNWSKMEPPVHHEVLLPSHVDEKFKSLNVLWNSVEQSETRRNSQVAIDVVLALPDDRVISVEDRIEMSRLFIEENFTKNGFGVQFDIHPPEQVFYHSEETGEMTTKEHNWHCHILITPRLFAKDGVTFEETKPRHLMPMVRKGKVVSGPNWGKMWGQFQNEYFEAKGIDLRVDIPGVVAQTHLGPVRMRGVGIEILDKQEELLSENRLYCSDPYQVLTHLTKTLSVFSEKELDQFLQKHLVSKSILDFKEEFWKQKNLVQLYDKKTGKPLDKFTSKKVFEEEKQIVRLADRFQSREALKVPKNCVDPQDLKVLNLEQNRAFDGILLGKSLTCIEGHAGTGKSYLLGSLRQTYLNAGYRVRAFGPDEATAKVLREKGFENTENIYRFLFRHYYQKPSKFKKQKSYLEAKMDKLDREGSIQGLIGVRKEYDQLRQKYEIGQGKEVWLLDEAGKLGNKPLLEFLKLADKNGVQVVLSGNSAQLPSVERGGMFGFLSDRYNAQFLNDIQRQKGEHHKDISKHLAKGQFPMALDKISSTGGFRWAKNKTKALELAVRKWAEDRTYFPYASTILIAHTNKEVLELNKMVHQYRKQLGEIGKEEYLCKTSRGEFLASKGDVIEFRSNDHKLGIFNGMQGVLTELSEKSMTVSVKGEKLPKTIRFNPEQFHNYSLGYASTYYRSQGRTIDRGYIVYNKEMTKEQLYVGFTRHVTNAFCFVSEKDASCISSIKEQILRKESKEIVHKYDTEIDIRSRQEREAKQELIQDLRESSSFLDRARGMGIETWDKLKEKVHSKVEPILDSRADRGFYDFDPDPEPIGTGKVQLVEEDIKMSPKLHGLQDILQEDKKREQVLPKAPMTSYQKAFSRLSEDHKSSLKDYYQKVDEASSVYEIVKSEAEKKGCREKECPHFSEWQAACADRNRSAYSLTGTLRPEDLKELFSPKAMEILKYRRDRHEASLGSKESLQEKLYQNMDSLLYKLFPEGPSRKDAKGYRFGSKGSLSVICSGSGAGTYRNFETDEKGGLLSLIQLATGLEKKEAVSWAKDFLNEPSDVQIPKQFSMKSFKEIAQETWVSEIPPQGAKPPELKEISRGLARTHKLTNRYEYRDSKGVLLFYTYRIVDEKTNKKSVLPVSYGTDSERGGESQWKLKGYSSQGPKVLYNQHLIEKHPEKTVLVVEGEKAADAGNRLFGKDTVCVSWLGGTGGVAKANWKALFGRNVVIWPDNDPAGFKAAESISQSLRRVGVGSLKVIDEKMLSESLPKKWDIADDLPNGKDASFLKDCVLRANQKAVGIDRLSSLLSKEQQKDPKALYEANEVLWRVDERLRPALEKEFNSKPWEIENRILGETQKILGSGVKIGMAFEELGHKGRSKEDLKQEAMIVYASAGIEPTKDEMKDMSNKVKDSAGELNKKPGPPLAWSQGQVERDQSRRVLTQKQSYETSIEV